MKKNKKDEEYEIGILRAEVIDLNILAHCFVRKMNRFSYLFQKTTRHHMYEEFTACRAMESGLILYLTKLDDDLNNSKYSFRGAMAELNKSKIDPRRRDKINTLLKKYRRDLHKLKNDERNKRVAHLNKHTEMELNQFINFNKEIHPLILQANAIADLVFDERVEYYFQLGKMGEGTLDFRKLTEGLKVDFESTKSW